MPTERYVDVDGKLVKPPPLRRLQYWTFDGVAEATDGCRVEPDGQCPHGKYSWLVIMGLV